jgi:hypothetical protein
VAGAADRSSWRIEAVSAGVETWFSARSTPPEPQAAAYNAQQMMETRARGRNLCTPSRRLDIIRRLVRSQSLAECRGYVMLWQKTS